MICICNFNFELANFILISVLLKVNFKNLSIGASLIISEYLNLFFDNTIESNRFNEKYSNCIYLICIYIILLVSLTKYIVLSVERDIKKQMFRLIGVIVLMYHSLYSIKYIINFSKGDFIKEVILQYYKIYFVWFGLICLSLVFFEKMNNIFTFKKIIKRKLYHFLAVSIFLIGHKFIKNDHFICICYLVVLFFILIENIRQNFDIPILKILSKYLEENIDHRDSKDFILTHTFLLAGCFISDALSLKNEYKLKDFDFSLPRIIGLTVLGIGDAFTAIIGSLYGKIKCYYPTNKTLEGSIGGFVFSLIFIYCLGIKITILSKFFF